MCNAAMMGVVGGACVQRTGWRWTSNSKMRNSPSRN